MPTTLPRSSNRLLATYVFVASLLLHLLALPGWVWWLERDATLVAEPVRAHCATGEAEALVQRPCRNAVECASEQAQSVTVALVDEREPERPPPPETMQVVSPSQRPEEEEATPPEDARFASTMNTSTERETVSRASGGGGPGEARPGAAAAAREAQLARASDTGREDALDRSAPDVELPRVDREDGAPVPDGRAPDASLDSERGERREPTLDELLPDFEAERVAAATAPAGGGGGVPGEGSIDYLRDVSEDERTLLNRRRVSYADFYERIKVGVVAHWNPIAVYRRRDPSGRVYGVEDRLTVLNVTLRGDGTLAQLYVERPSGLEFLDDEAVRAMNAAVPFPNPPEGLKDLDGQVNFRFAFQVDVSTRQYRMFRYR